MGSGVAFGLGGNVKMAYGSYHGTGRRGAANPTTISVGFEPRFVYIKKSSIGAISNTLMSLAAFGVYPSSEWIGFGVSTGPGSNVASLASSNIQWDTNSISLIDNNSSYQQMNGQNEVYYYLIIGE